MQIQDKQKNVKRLRTSKSAIRERATQINKEH